MSPQLRNMVFAAAAALVAGGSYVLFTPVPATRSMAELRDAGIADGQKFVLVCPERLTAQTKRRIEKVQPGLLRPSQGYAHVGRVADCFSFDGGNCFKPADFSSLVTNGEIIVSSLRRDLVGVDASVADNPDGGESDAVDDGLQYAANCEAYKCGTYDAGDGLFPDGACTNRNRLWLVPSPCMIPNCWTAADGGWDDNAVVDCRFLGPWTESDGGAHWRGCNTGPAQYAVGSQCVPTECSIVAGDDPTQWL